MKFNTANNQLKLSNKIHDIIVAQIDKKVYYKVYMSLRDKVWDEHDSMRQSIKQKIKKEQ